MPASSASRDWFDYVSALTPALIAVFVAFVACRQWMVARQKLRLDLYNKRFAVFELALRLYQESLGGTELTEQEYEELHRKFITAMIEARFLFAPDSGIAKVMEEFNKSVFIIKGSRRIMRQSGFPQEELNKVSDKFTEEQLQLPKKLEDIERRMKPYLSFSQQAE